MMVTRRETLTHIAATGIGAGFLNSQQSHAVENHSARVNPQITNEWKYSLNTSCIREAKLTLPEIVQVVSKSGYDAFEPWDREIEQYLNSGGSLKDLRKQIEDAGIKLISSIGFARWAVDDDQERQAGLEAAKQSMDRVRQLGGAYIAAPPAGINNSKAPVVELDRLGERYRALLNAGESQGVTPQLEIWGSSRNLSRLPQAAYVAMAAQHDQAGLLLDIYHLYRGGSDFHGLQMLSGQSMNLFHFNDYPASPPREIMKDTDRVYPGDGIAPWNQIIQSLAKVGFTGTISLELFNRDYWKQDPMIVAKTGLQKMKQVVGSSMPS